MSGGACLACGRDAGAGRAFCLVCEAAAVEAAVSGRSRRCPRCGSSSLRLHQVARNDGVDVPWSFRFCGACAWRVLLGSVCSCGGLVEWAPGGEPGVGYCLGCLRSYRLEGVGARPGCSRCGVGLVWTIYPDDRPAVWSCPVCAEVKPADVGW